MASRCTNADYRDVCLYRCLCPHGYESNMLPSCMRRPADRHTILKMGPWTDLPTSTEFNCKLIALCILVSALLANVFSKLTGMLRYNFVEKWHGGMRCAQRTGCIQVFKRQS